MTKTTSIPGRPSSPLKKLGYYVVHVALTTTTRGSSVRQPNGEVGATRRFVALCGAKQGHKSLWQNKKTGIHSGAWLLVPHLPIFTQLWLWAMLHQKKAAWFWY